MKEFDTEEQAFANGFSSGYAAGMRTLKSMTLKAVADPDANIPTRAHKNDAGLDLYATKSGWILPKCRKVFGTGFHCAIPKNFVGMLTSKSGLMLKGITSRGTIDSDYRGEIKAILYNHRWLPYHVKKGQKITQLVIMPIVTPKLKVVDSLGESERGSNGFGSTGL